eukprot:Skav203478  [mRNA]  locus=scaffold921:244183:245631:+ [translate_table: standard]
MVAQPAHAIRLRCKTPKTPAPQVKQVKKKNQTSAARQAALREGVVGKAAKPFALFVKQNSSVGKGKPAKEHREEMRRLGCLWRGLSDKEKEPFKVMCSEGFAAQRAAMLRGGIVNGTIMKQVKVQEAQEEANGANGANGEEQGLTTGAAGQTGQFATQNVDKVGPFALQDQIGEGTYGRVFASYSPTGIKVAVKVWKTDDWQQEVEAWQHLSKSLSVSAVRMRDGAFFPTIVDVDSAGKPFPWMAFEYAGETLLKVLSVDGPFQPPKARNLAAQVRSALKVLHEVGICHCDLHTRNVLWQRGIERAKLVDLGMSEFWKGPLSKNELGHSVYTCAAFRCPELWAHAGKASLKSVISPKVDYWAFGCLVYHTCTARMLFKPLDNSSTISRSSEEKSAAIHKAIASWCGVHASLPQAAQTSLGRPLGGQRSPRSWPSNASKLASNNNEHTWRARMSLAGGLTEAIMLACHPEPSERTMVNTLRQT